METNVAPNSSMRRAYSCPKASVPNCLPAAWAAAATWRMADWTTSESNCPGTPASTEKSPGPKNRPSMPSTSAIALAFGTAVGDSIWARMKVSLLAALI